MKLFNTWSDKLKDILNLPTDNAFPKEELEKILFESDLSAEMVETLVRKTKGARNRGKDAVLAALVEETKLMLSEVPSPNLNLPTPGCILLVGVNGSGKTTTAARLAYHFKQKGREVILGAGDTFRAGAVEQLKTWGDRLHIDVIANPESSDPASVLFETWQKAKERNGLMIGDTAGRIHTHVPLMDQLQKIFRAISKTGEGAPHEVWLVLDGTNGQNAIAQSKEYFKNVPLTGLVVTKLDGTAKGGGALYSSIEFNLPIRYIGIGEREGDLIEFDLDAFVKSFYGV